MRGADLLFEFMLNRLRLPSPFPLTLFTERTGLPVARVLPILEQAQARGLMYLSRETVGTTALGQRFLDTLLQLFLPEPDGVDHAGMGHDQLSVLR